MSSANPGLSYDDAPPFSVPLRYFLTAPLFGIAAGALLLIDGSALGSRWSPAALGAVHLVATGIMLQVMLGALMQILPVVAGATLLTPRRTARLTHPLLAGGSVGLSWGLWQGHPGATLAGAALLAAGLVIFLLAATLAFRRAPSARGRSDTPRDLRLALIGLLVTAALGVLLATALARGLSLPIDLPALVNLHAGWAWMGWGAMLVAATSWVIVPMFQITPAYPQRLTRIWAPSVLILLALWSMAAIASLHGIGIALAGLLCALAIGFGATTLRLQARSRRSTPDASFLAFRLAMASIIAGSVAILASLVTEADALPLLAGILILHGGFVGAISAMLYKIVPFLAWLHLTQARIKAPNVKKLSPDLPVRRQLITHAAALALLLGSVFLPLLSYAAGAAIMLEFGWLLGNLARIVLAWQKAGGRWNPAAAAEGKKYV